MVTRRLLLPALALLAAGCAEVLREAERGAAPPPAAGPVELVPQPDLIGGRLTAQRGAAGMPLVPTGPLLRFVRPVALAAGRGAGADLYVADAGQARIFRLDPLTGAMTAVGTLASADVQLALGADQRLLVIDGAARRVSQLVNDTQLLAPLAAEVTELGRPVDATVDPARGTLYVADGLYRQVLAWNPAGGAFALILPRGMEGAAPGGLAGIAWSRHGLYLLDPGCRCVLLMALDGRVLGRVGGSELVQPVRIATDAVDRLFVADDGARELRIYVDGRPLQAFAYRSFGLNAVSALRVTDDTLYLAGADDGHIEVRRIVPARAPGTAR